MPSLGDSAFIILLGLLLFGPKGLAQIARQVGKLMGEFRRASNEFRMQMEEELRISEQEDRQKKIAAIEAAAPEVPLLTSPVAEDTPEYTHLHAAAPETALAASVSTVEPPANSAEKVVPLPIATSGSLNIMPPATGLPSPRASSPIMPLLDAVPQVGAPDNQQSTANAASPDFSEQKPVRHTNHFENGTATAVVTVTAPAAESVHG